MTDYVKSTNFAVKDTLPTGNALKIVKGTEINTEFDNIATAVASKADSSSVTSSLAGKADVASPAFTGNPTAPTPTAGDNDTSIATTAFVSTAVSTAVSGIGATGFKNRIINGAMTISQRGTSFTPTADSYTLDRFSSGMSQASKMTFAQSSTAPAGFSNSMSVTVASVPTVGSSDWFGFFHKVEGFNSADFGFGATGASTVTISFWVRSSVTGVYGGSLMNSAQNRSYPYTYTVNAANTWEQKTVTIAGDTSGTWVGATNGTGLLLIWSLGAGSSFLGTANAWGTTNALGTTGQQNWVTNSGATFYITGIQIEKGSTATSFDYRPYGTELALCQRYYYKVGPTGTDGFTQLAFANITSTTNHVAFLPCPPMRAAATSIDYANIGFVTQWVAGVTSISALTLQRNNPNGATLSATLSGALGSVGGVSIFLQNNNSGGYVALSAEL